MGTPLEKDELKPVVLAKNESNATDFDEAFIEEDGEASDFEEDTEFELLEENDVLNVEDVEGVDITNATGEEVLAKNESAPIEFGEEEELVEVEGKLPEDDTSDHKAVFSEEEVADDEEEDEEEELVEVEDDVEEEE